MYDVFSKTFHGEVTMRCQAFSGEGIKMNRIRIMGDIVQVWDDYAGFFTSNHKLGTRQIARAKQILRKQR